MPKLVPLTGTKVIRDGRAVRPAIGEAFNFTAEEIKSLEAGGTKFRNTVNEDADGGEGGSTPSSAEVSQSKARGGSKPSTAAKSDKEAAKDDDL